MEVANRCSLTHRRLVQNSLDFFPAAVSTLHIEHGGSVPNRMPDSILTPRETHSVEHSRPNEGALVARLFPPDGYHRQSESSSLQDRP
jgi:hypothetical protein